MKRFMMCLGTMTGKKRTFCLSCCCKLKPARMMLLRNSIQAQGKGDEFATFADEIDALLSPLSLTPHGFSTTFSGMDSDRILKSLGDTLRPLEALGRPFFLHSGALLGYIRDGRLIDYDDDVDIGIYLGNCARTDVAKEWLGYKYALANAKLLDPKTLDEDRPVYKFHSSLGIDIDIFPAWSENGKFSIYPNSFYQMQDSDVFPLASFGQDPLRLPAKPEVMLEQSYGKGWKIPDPLFHLDWKRKKKKFKMLFDVNYALPASPAD